MTPDEREQMAILFERIATEKNLQNYERWVRDINEIFDRKQRRLTLGQPLSTRS